MAEQLPTPLTDAECYRMVRGQIEFEAGLLAQRFNWFVASQSFFFTAYAITLNGVASPAPAKIADQQRLVNHLIPVVAFASCLLIYIAVVAAVIAQRRLSHFLNHHLSPPRQAPFPAVQGAGDTRAMGLAAPLGMPLVFMVVWAVLFFSGMA